MIVQYFWIEYIQKHKDFEILCKSFVMIIVLEIKVIPRARKQLLKADPVYDLRCYVNSPPEDNKANQEVVDFLSKILGISKSSVTVIAGATARIKRIAIDGFESKQALFKKLDMDVQHGLF